MESSSSRFFLLKVLDKVTCGKGQGKGDDEPKAFGAAPNVVRQGGGQEVFFFLLGDGKRLVVDMDPNHAGGHRQREIERERERKNGTYVGVFDRVLLPGSVSSRGS
jgi:hypothetical protein